jgi:hypothetical protein
MQQNLGEASHVLSTRNAFKTRGGELGVQLRDIMLA